AGVQTCALPISWDAANVVAAVFACCTACSAACCVVEFGRTGSFFSLKDARVNEGWVSSLGKAKRGAEIFKSLDEPPAAVRGDATLYLNSGRAFSFCCDVNVVEPDTGCIGVVDVFSK